jgi:hypothetical protein
VPERIVDSLNIDVDDLTEFLGGHFPDGSVGVDDSSVVDEQIGRAKVVGELFREKPKTDVVCDID